MKWPVAGQFLQEQWQRAGSRVQLRGRWDQLDAELVALDWPLPERGLSACFVDSQGARIVVYDPTRRAGTVGRVVRDVQIRMQPDEAAAALTATPDPNPAHPALPLPARSVAPWETQFPAYGRHGRADCILALEILEQNKVKLPVPKTELGSLLPACAAWARSWLDQNKDYKKRMANNPGIETARKRLRKAMWAMLEANRRD